MTTKLNLDSLPQSSEFILTFMIRKGDAKDGLLNKAVNNNGGALLELHHVIAGIPNWTIKAGTLGIRLLQVMASTLPSYVLEIANR